MDNKNYKILEWEMEQILQNLLEEIPPAGLPMHTPKKNEPRRLGGWQRKNLFGDIELNYTTNNVIEEASVEDFPI